MRAKPLPVSLALLLLLLSRGAFAQEASPFDNAIDKQVEIELLSGVAYSGATLLRVSEDRRTGEPSSLRVKLDSGKNRTIRLKAVRKVTAGEELLFENEASEEDEKRTRRVSPSRAAAAADAKAAKDKQRMARAIARGIQPWPEASDREHLAAVNKCKQQGMQVQQMLPSVQLYETARFLFYTNIPPEEVRPYVEKLDQMYGWMAATYNLPPGSQVWLGKTPVYAFLEQRQFAAFERRYFKNNLPSGVYGLCHQNSNGDVLIACYRGKDLAEFAQMLVHETSHGFIHRYKTKKPLPNWVNEGMADYIGALMVPDSLSVPMRESRAKERLKRTPTIRLGFFGPGKIEHGEYGLASSLTRFMLETNGESYVEFIECLKEGMPWQESLQAAYHSEPIDLVNAYAKWIGVAEIRVE